MNTKRKTSSGRSHSLSESSHVTTRGDIEALIKTALAEREAAAPAEPAADPPVRRMYNKRHVDPTATSRKRVYADTIDDFELGLARHGISLFDLMKASRNFDSGTSTPYTRLAHAVLSWWCSIPMTGRRVMWVDPDSGYTDRTCPKFSTLEGKDLVNRGLAGAMWVSTRKHLLEARAWARSMLQLTPAQRIASPVQLGDERLSR